MTKESDLTKESRAEIAREHGITSTPLAVRLAMGALDTLAVVAILALAIIGAMQIINSSLQGEVKVGLAVAVVGLLAARLTERVFAARR